MAAVAVHVTPVILLWQMWGAFDGHGVVEFAAVAGGLGHGDFHFEIGPHPYYFR